MQRIRELHRASTRGMIFPGVTRAHTMKPRRVHSPSRVSESASFADLVARSKQIRQRRRSQDLAAGATSMSRSPRAEAARETGSPAPKTKEDHIEALVAMCEEADKLRGDGLLVKPTTMTSKKQAVQWSISFTPKHGKKRGVPFWDRRRESAPSRSSPPPRSRTLGRTHRKTGSGGSGRR